MRVIFDESFAGVDIFALRNVRQFLRRCFDSSSRAILMYSHWLVLAGYTDHVIVFSDGAKLGPATIHLMARSFEAAGDRLALGRGLDEDARPRPVVEQGVEARPLGLDASLDQFAVL